MVTSVNQVRQFYVATAKDTVSEAASSGTIAVQGVGDSLNKELFFEYKGKKTVLRSDLIPVANIEYVKPIAFGDLRVPLKKVEVACDSNINSGAPIAGQDYVLRIELNQFYGNTDEGKYCKDVAVHVTAAMEATPSLFYTALVNELNAAFSREIGATKTSNPYLSFTAASTKITIAEKIQDWNLGMGPVQRVQFDVFPTTIYTGGADVIWGVATEATLTKTTPGTDCFGDGRQLAELEWFCMGERGDQYRQVGYPNYIPTQYMIDPTKEYNVLEIHYSFKDTGVNSYKSEKDITIAVPKGAASHEYDLINGIIDDIETVTGLTIAGLS